MTDIPSKAGLVGLPAILLAALLLLPACGDSGLPTSGELIGSDGVARPADTAPPTVAEPAYCDDLRLVLQQRVHQTDADDVDFDQAVAIFESIASVVDEPVASDLREFVEMIIRAEADPDSFEELDAVHLLELHRALMDWSFDACPPVKVTWVCVPQYAYEPMDSTDPDEVYATAEDAAWPNDRSLDRVELDRSDNRALFAFVDRRGLAHGSIEVVRSGGTWTWSEEVACD